MSDNVNMQYAALDTSWEEVFQEDNRAALEAILPDYIRARRWFGGKARTIQAVRIVEAIPLRHATSTSYLVLIKVEYAEGDPQTYVLPLTFASGENAGRISNDAPAAVVTRLGGDEITHYALRITPPGVLYDATWDKEFAIALLDAIKGGQRFPTEAGEIKASATETFSQMFGSAQAPLEPSVIGAEQSNTSLVYGDRFILKLFRRLEEGTSPDLEVGRFLAQKGFSHTPPVVGAIEHYRDRGEPITLAILQGYVRNQGDAWRYTLDSLAPYFEQAVKQGSGAQGMPTIPQQHLLDLLEEETPTIVKEAIGPYLESARLLGRRTAEMHVALASDEGDPAFAPEPFSAAYQQSIYDSSVGMADEALGLLSRQLGSLPEEARAEAQAIVDGRDELLSRMGPLIAREVAATRTRCHGDYHLGQVLYTGSDFVIIDFEGEPVRPLHERRRKHSPLKDVGGMLRSFHYAAYAAMMGPGESAPHLSAWADNWHQWVGVAYLKEYLEVAGSANFLPQTREELRLLLDTYLLEKATYELLYELNNRPDWVRIPLKGIGQLIK